MRKYIFLTTFFIFTSCIYTSCKTETKNTDNESNVIADYIIILPDDLDNKNIFGARAAAEQINAESKTNYQLLEIGKNEIETPEAFEKFKGDKKISFVIGGRSDAVVAKGAAISAETKLPYISFSTNYELLCQQKPSAPALYTTALVYQAYSEPMILYLTNLSKNYERNFKIEFFEVTHPNRISVMDRLSALSQDLGLTTTKVTKIDYRLKDFYPEIKSILYREPDFIIFDNPQEFFGKILELSKNLRLSDESYLAFTPGSDDIEIAKQFPTLKFTSISRFFQNSDSAVKGIERLGLKDKMVTQELISDWVSSVFIGDYLLKNNDQSNTDTLELPQGNLVVNPRSPFISMPVYAEIVNDKESAMTPLGNLTTVCK